MQKYQISNKRHYIDKITGVTVPFKGKNTITLDSTLELKIYREIKDNYSDLIEIEPHRALQLPGRSWVIDFVIYSKGTYGRKLFRRLLEFYGIERQTTVIYLECKGVQDNNFKSKLAELIRNSPLVSECLILVAYEGQGFFYESKDSYLIKPILSIELFTNTLARLKESIYSENTLKGG